MDDSAQHASSQDALPDDVAAAITPVVSLGDAPLAAHVVAFEQTYANLLAILDPGEEQR